MGEGWREERGERREKREMREKSEAFYLMVIAQSH